MRLIYMKNHRQFKIGFEEEKELLYDSYEKLEAKIEANSNAIVETRSVVAELALARHASSYGLLGVKFLPFEDGEKNILIIETRFNDCGKRFTEAISNSREYTYLGLRKEYAPSVLSSSIEFFRTSSIVPAGKLIFNMGACCEVGSSIKIFSCLTKILLEILFKEYKKMSDKQISNICDQIIQ